jgi:hypothetical protein
MGLLLFFNVLDCVDGSIARTTKTENPYGRFLDAVCGGVIDLAFWAVVGIMAYRHGGLLVWQNPFGLGSFFWLAIGGATCFSSILVAFLERAYDRSLREAWEKISTSKQDVKGIGHEPKNASIYLNNVPANRSHPFRLLNNNLRVALNSLSYLLFLSIFHSNYLLC